MNRGSKSTREDGRPPEKFVNHEQRASCLKTQNDQIGPQNYRLLRPPTGHQSCPGLDIRGTLLLYDAVTDFCLSTSCFLE